MTADEACRAAIRVQCERIVVCQGGSMDDCMRFADLCPDYYFNSDSNRTIAGVVACLPALGARTCTDIALSLYPSCFARGKRAGGAVCAFPSQCESGGCGGGTACATCAAGAVPVGATCTNAVCQAGAFCHAGVCSDGSSVVHASEGQPCDLTATPVVGCAGDLLCIAASSAANAGTCSRAPGAGHPCAQSFPSAMVCAPGTTCTSPSGGTCEVTGACGAGVVCDATSYCRMEDGGAACAPLAAAGEPCGSGAGGIPPCRAPALCVPETGHCAVPRAANESCDAANPCASVLRCEAGTCRALTVQSCSATDAGAD